MNNIHYKINEPLDAATVAALFREAEINRPVDDLQRIQKMVTHANLTISAWDEMKPVGIARAFTDFSYCCYLSNLAVVKPLQRAGIGRRLLEILKDQIGDGCSLILLSAPEAMAYYPKVGFEPIVNGFIRKRLI